MVENIWGSTNLPIVKQKSEYEKLELINKPRKKRSDTKNNIKYPLSPIDFRDLEWKAMEHNLSLTSYSNMIIENELKNGVEYNDYKYNSKWEHANTRLKEEDAKQIRRLKVEWGVDKKQVVSIIIKNYLERTRKIGISVWDGRDNHEI